MKLRDKKTASVESQEVRRQQIEEGMMLAKKIDMMRALFASLEQQRDLKIAQCEKELERALIPLRNKALILEGEIRILEDRKAEFEKDWRKKLTILKNIK